MQNIINYPGNLHLFIVNFILLFKGYGNLFWSGLGIFFIGLLVFLSVYNYISSNPKKCLHSKALFLLIIAITILILRFPNLALFEQNEDESQWMVGAATLIKDPRFWISVDCNSSGPLNISPLVLAVLFGGINYATIRLFALLFCIIPTVIFLYFAFTNLFNEKISRIIILPLVVSMAFANHFDIIAYNGEHIPMLLLAMSIFFYSKTISPISIKKKNSYLFATGFVCGLTPYAKLQATPIILAIFFFCLVEIVVKDRLNLRALLRNSFPLVCGVLLPSFIILIYLILNGAVIDFFNEYIVSNFWYFNWHDNPLKNKWSGKLQFFLGIIRVVPEMWFYFFSLFLDALVAGYFLFRLQKYIKGSQWKLVVLAILLLSAAYYAIISPRNNFFHYQILFIVPALFFTGILIGLVYEVCLKHRQRNTKMPINLIVVIVIMNVVVSTLLSILIGSQGIYEINDLNAHNPRYQKSAVANKINKYAHPGERMAIWGRKNRYYIEAGLLQGAREAINYWPTTAGSLQHYFLKQYAFDITANKPKIFLDLGGYEQFPIIKAVVDQNYVFTDEVDGARIYVRREELNK